MAMGFCANCGKPVDLKGKTINCSASCSIEWSVKYKKSARGKEISKKGNEKYKIKSTKLSLKRHDVIKRIPIVYRGIKDSDMKKAKSELVKSYPLIWKMVNHLYNTGLIDEYEDRIMHLVDVRFKHLCSDLSIVHDIVSKSIGNSQVVEI
jgi:hypothetical protein